MGVAEFHHALSQHSVIFIDTMVFIYLLDNHPIYADLAGVIFTLIETGELRGVTSTLSLAEILTAPAKAGDLQAMHDYELYLTNFPNLEFQAPNNDVAREAALIRGATGLKLPDAFQIAITKQAGLDAIVTNDKAWRGKTGNVSVLLLDDFLANSG